MLELTARDIHEAYNYAIKTTDAKHPQKSRVRLTEWDDVSPESREMYDHMVRLLNVKLARQEKFIEGGDEEKKEGIRIPPGHSVSSALHRKV